MRIDINLNKGGRENLVGTLRSLLIARNIPVRAGDMILLTGREAQKYIKVMLAQERADQRRAARKGQK